MSYPDFEYKAERLASDLDRGNARDAANVLRDEIYTRPCETPALIDRAYQLSSPYRRDDILEDRFGNVAVRDRYTGYQFNAGRIPEYCRGGYPGPGIPIPIPIPFPFPIPHGDHHRHRH